MRPLFLSIGTELRRFSKDARSLKNAYWETAIHSYLTAFWVFCIRQCSCPGDNGQRSCPQERIVTHTTILTHTLSLSFSTMDSSKRATWLVERHRGCGERERARERESENHQGMEWVSSEGWRELEGRRSESKKEGRERKKRIEEQML